jgi:hypothetical protein
MVLHCGLGVTEEQQWMGATQGTEQPLGGRMTLG